MNPSPPRDIQQELLELFRSENFIAYFDFSLFTEKGNAVSGLCKISRSQNDGMCDTGSAGYLSLILIMDTPDDESRAAVKRVMNEFNEDELKRFMPDLDTLIPMPDMNVGSQMYVKHVDALLKQKLSDERGVIAGNILPFFKEHLNAGIINIEWWEDRDKPSAEPARGVEKAPKGRESLLNKLKSLLRR